jgi:nucleoside-diphosphate-sugar epimerase
MHVLIIGCGYLGLKVARRLLQGGTTVSALTRSPARAEEWSALGIRPVIGDVLAPVSLTSLPDADICLYAVGYDRGSKADKRTIYVDGLQNVLTAIQDKVRHVVYISSTSVYGQDAGETVDEDSACVPLSEGGKICLEAENVLRKWTERPDSPRASIVRLAGIYGPQRLVARVDQLKSGTPLTGEPDAWLNLIHVEDAAQGVLNRIEAISQSEQPETRQDVELFLLSDAQPLRRREFYEEVALRCGAPVPVFAHHGETGLNKRCESSRSRKRLRLQLQFPNALAALPELITPE